jgi:DNA-binding transcriptional ArsR family regulator
VAESEGYADAAILELLAAAGPLTARSIAADLAVPVRTIRHRLMRLREDGAVAPAGEFRYSVPSTAPVIATVPEPTETPAPQLEDPQVRARAEPHVGRQPARIGPGERIAGLAMAGLAITILMLTRRPGPRAGLGSNGAALPPDLDYWGD